MRSAEIISQIGHVSLREQVEPAITLKSAATPTTQPARTGSDHTHLGKDDSRFVFKAPARTVLEQTSHLEILTREQERELGIKKDTGTEEEREAAIETFMLHNLRLVSSLTSKHHPPSMDENDLFNEGCIGLRNAVVKFDYRKGYKFSTYATWWIRRAVTRAIANEDRIIRLPVKRVEQINKLNRITKGLSQTLGREPSAEELAEEVGLTADEILTLEKVGRQTTSLNALVNDDEDRSELLMFQVDGSKIGIDPVEIVSEKMRDEVFYSCLGGLPSKERKVLEFRLGLDGHKPHSAKETAIHFGVNETTVWRLEKTGMARLSKNPDFQSLRETGTE